MTFNKKESASKHGQYKPNRQKRRFEILESSRHTRKSREDFSRDGFLKPGALSSTQSLGDEGVGDKDDPMKANLIVFNPYRNFSLKQQRRMLPIYKSRRKILYALETNRILIIVAETGSGKTTQIPQYLDESGWTSGNKKIAVTQPRRVAATSVAKRVAQEMNVELGAEVGYSIRFDSCFDYNRTRIKYLTDGMLLRETMLDPLLSQYSIIMLDEAHERTLHTDILIGLLKKIMRKRFDLKLIISSATLEAHDFLNFFSQSFTNSSYNLNNGDQRKRRSRFDEKPSHILNSEEKGNSKNEIGDVAVLSVEGRQFPVDVQYSIEPVRSYIDSVIETVANIHLNEPPGDILVFLTGEEEIVNVVSALKERCPPNDLSSSVSIHSSSSDKNSSLVLNLRPLPLYGSLELTEQLKCFESFENSETKRYRKVIVATNLAETSVTIPGIVYVVDSMFCKIRQFDPLTNTDSLTVCPVSQSSANQRKGRAGRVRPGKCFRLCREADFTKLPQHNVPEMQRSNLVYVVLQLKALGIDNILNFDFLSPPPVEVMIRALELLYSLGALDDSCKLTPKIGTFLSELPVEPRFARMLYASGEMECSEEILSIASMLSVPGQVFVQSRSASQRALRAKNKFAVLEGDHLTLLNVFNSFQLQQKNPNQCYERYLNYRFLKKAVEIRKHLRRYLKRFNVEVVSCEGDVQKILRCIVVGFFSNAAQLQSDGSYKTVRGNMRLHIHPNSTQFRQASDQIIYHDVVVTTQRYMRTVSKIDPLQLSEIAPHFYEYKQPGISQLQNESLEQQ